MSIVRGESTYSEEAIGASGNFHLNYEHGIILKYYEKRGGDGEWMAVIVPGYTSKNGRYSFLQPRDLRWCYLLKHKNTPRSADLDPQVTVIELDHLYLDISVIYDIRETMHVDHAGDSAGILNQSASLVILGKVRDIEMTRLERMACQFGIAPFLAAQLPLSDAYCQARSDSGKLQDHLASHMSPSTTPPSTTAGKEESSRGGMAGSNGSFTAEGRTNQPPKTSGHTSRLQKVGLDNDTSAQAPSQQALAAGGSAQYNDGTTHTDAAETLAPGSRDEFEAFVDAEGPFAFPSAPGASTVMKSQGKKREPQNIGRQEEDQPKTKK